MTINDICTQLNLIADECGGDHHTNKEIEIILKDLSRKLFDITWDMLKLSNQSLSVMHDMTGISERDFKDLFRIERSNE